VFSSAGTSTTIRGSANAIRDSDVHHPREFPAVRSVYSGFVPVVSTSDEENLDVVLAQPFSYVSTDGPRWRTAAQRRQIIDNDSSSHMVIFQASEVVGAISWTRGQTPGFFRLSITSCQDDAWTPHLVYESVSQAMTLILRSSEARRVELAFGTYNEALLRYVTSARTFTVEGILRDRYFVDGTYWPGVICAADLNAFTPVGRPETRDHDVLLELLRKNLATGLSVSRESLMHDSGDAV
jgi:hypothetical protein